MRAPAVDHQNGSLAGSTHPIQGDAQRALGFIGRHSMQIDRFDDTKFRPLEIA